MSSLFSQFSIRLRFSLLWFLFFFTPIIYAWLYIPGISGDLSVWTQQIFGIEIGGFEAVKVHFFIILTSIITVLTLGIFAVQEKCSQLFKAIVITLGVFFLWTICALFANPENVYFVLGTAEKQHGWFFYLSLIILFFILRSLPKAEKSKLLNASLWGFGVVVLYAIFQYIGLDPLKNQYETRLDLNRIFSTTGNPNYLAGLALMVIPLILERMNNEKGIMKNGGFFMFILIGLIVYSTGSIFAYGTFAAYLIYQILRYLIMQNGPSPQPSPKGRGSSSYQLPVTNYALFGTLLVLFLALFVIYNHFGNSLFEMQKIKGFLARGFLWNTGIHTVIADPLHFLFGRGPDGFLAVSEQFRDWHLSNGFEDPAYRIDSSHNVFIDLAIQFGVPMFVALIWFAVKGFRKLSSYKQASVVLFAVYFIFNIPVLVHYLLLVQIFSSDIDD